MTSIGGLMSILCICFVISKGWIHLDALNNIVHHLKAVGKEINRSCNYFYGILVVWCFCIVSSSVISFSHVLCMPQSNSLLLAK